ncbi:MAG: hypothetical protein ACRDPC_21265 [Solirubrobacteraceae bacterium]
MTLNLTLLTPDAVYQAADFRLTDGDTGDPIDSQSMKLVTVHYWEWEGFITYTGVGRWRNKDTSEWIVEWLTGLSDASPDAVIDRVRMKGTEYLQRIERSPRGRRHHHTFVFAAFVNGIPRVATISNFEDCSGRTEGQPAAALSVDSRVMRRRSLLLVTGQKPAVRRASRRRLERLAERSQTSPAVIRSALTQMNAEAAGVAEAHGTVSVGCSVTSFRRDGSGFQDFAKAGTAHPRSVMNGEPMPDLAGLVGANPGSVRGISFARSVPDADRQPYSPCVPRTVTPAGGDAFELRELRYDEFEAAIAGDVNERATVLGSGTRPGQPGANLLCIWDAESPRLLGFSGNARVRGLNSRGEVAVTADMSDGSVHATRWSPAGGARDLGTFHGVESEVFADSGATAMNDAGVVVGWISLSADRSDRGQGNYRPAAWIPGEDAVFLTDLGFAWGQAVDINAAGTVLLVAYTEGIMGKCKALLWDPMAGTLTHVGADEPDGVYPSSLTASGLVLGTGRNRNGETIACVSRLGGPWMRLGTPDGWYATTMNEAGDVAGRCVVEGFGRPWLRRSTGAIVWLPYLEHHHCQPSSLATEGFIVGTAQTDHGTHALLWHSIE